MRLSVDSRSFRIALLSVLAGASVASAAEVLPSWNDGPSKRAIVKFVTDVTTAGAPTFVPVADRLAVFDNDEATAKGWTVVDMKQEWRKVFSFE
jgi:hypothetical protein